jgi:hypothetical protein
MGELRCNSKKHGVVTDEKLLEIKCDSRFCGARKGVIVLHLFDMTTGELVRTVQFKNPAREVNSTCH